ncbi:hypothetical protein F5Y16DRAFT_203716 [Xylariaceae sp. FL0255]|nr:hypothetical protein F5Y16DRAFT_203716 [Xylariaceae sp. FL0255]
MKPFAIRMPTLIGNDICEMLRIKKILSYPPRGRQFIKRILNPNELENFKTKQILSCILNPGPDGLDESTPQFSRAVEFMAGRFAAKEAVIKAHPFSGLTFQGITLIRTSTPKIMVDSPAKTGPVLAMFFQNKLRTHAPISISHEKDYATAVCLGTNQQILEVEPDEPPTTADGPSPLKLPKRRKAASPLGIATSEEPPPHVRTTTPADRDKTEMDLGPKEFERKTITGWFNDSP